MSTHVRTAAKQRKEKKIGAQTGDLTLLFCVLG